MMQDIQRLHEEYLSWLKAKTTFRQIGSWTEITTPYLDRHNDHLQIYAQKDDGQILLSDDGYTIADLRISGCDLDTPKRRRILRETLNGFGVALGHNEALEARASLDNFPMKKHSLVQAMLAVNDLFYLAEPIVKSLFFEDVAEWFALIGVRYTPRLMFSGRSGFTHSFDFVIPGFRTAPERVVETINHATRDKAEALIFRWTDTRETRPEESHAYAIINDEEREPPPGVLQALRNYDIRAVLWSQRDAAREELAA